jgi:hypothetical protein
MRCDFAVNVIHHRIHLPFATLVNEIGVVYSLNAWGSGAGVLLGFGAGELVKNVLCKNCGAGQEGECKKKDPNHNTIYGMFDRCRSQFYAPTNKTFWPVLNLFRQNTWVIIKRL